jgi:hypothetical protein
MSSDGSGSVHNEVAGAASTSGRSTSTGVNSVCGAVSTNTLRIARLRSSREARRAHQRRSTASRAGSAWIAAGTSIWADSKPFRPEVRRRCVHYDDQSCACDHAVSDGTADASGSKPMPSRRDVHYVADSTGVGKSFVAYGLGAESLPGRILGPI